MNSVCKVCGKHYYSVRTKKFCNVNCYKSHSNKVVRLKKIEDDFEEIFKDIRAIVHRQSERKKLEEFQKRVTKAAQDKAMKRYYNGKS